MPHPPLALSKRCIDSAGPDRPSAPKAGEYLLFTRAGIVKGAIVDQRVIHANATASYKPLIVIEDEPPAHIREILIRGGHGQTHDEGTRRTIYVGQNKWLLNNGGESIRIRGSDGTVLAVYEIPVHTCDVLPAPKGLGSVVTPAAGVAVPAFGED